jgi:hypothetical protein
MHLKVFVKLEKTLKTLSSGQKKTQKKNKKTQTQKKTKKTQKNPTGLGFFKKTRVFSNPDSYNIELLFKDRRLPLEDPNPCYCSTHATSLYRRKAENLLEN